MIVGHGGNIYEMAERLGCRPCDITDMSSNLNPLGPPEGLEAYLKAGMGEMMRLPEVDARGINLLVAEKYGISLDSVLAGNGTTQFIYSIPRALESRKVLIVGPTYADYADACKMNKAEYSFFISREEDCFVPDVEELNGAVKGHDTVFLCNPNNPTGVKLPDEKIEYLCRSNPETFFIIDESYLPFASDTYGSSMIRRGLSNVIVLNSMSKVFRIPGLRVGFLLAGEKIIERFAAYALPWSVNALAQAAVMYLLEKGEGISQFLENTRAFVEEERALFVDRLKDNPAIRLFPADSYFILAKLASGMKAADLCDRLAAERLLIRNCSNFVGLTDEYVRFSLKDRETNLKLLRGLNKALGVSQ